MTIRRGRNFQGKFQGKCAAMAIVLYFCIMPKLAYIGSFIVYIFAYDVQERLHVHVAEGSQTTKRAAKFWLEPRVEVFDVGSLSDKEVNMIRERLEEHQEELVSLVKGFALGVKVKPLFM